MNDRELIELAAKAAGIKPLGKAFELMMVLSELELLISLSHLRFPSHLHNRFTDALNKLKADIIK